MAAFHIHKPVKKSSNAAGIVLVVVVALIAIALLAVSVGYVWYQQNLQPVSQETTEVVVSIEDGASAQEIAEQLHNAELVRSKVAFDWYLRLQGVRGQLQAGSYKIAPNNSVPDIVNMLRDGTVATDLITILPAQRIDQVRAAFAQAGFDRSDIINGFDADQYKGHPALAYKPAEASLEGYLYPETFQKSSNTAVSDIIRASLDEMATVLTPELIRLFNDQGLSPHEAVILASIVEVEVPAESDDRPTVAQVYLKRLREEMRLEADPTAQYGTLFATGTQDGWRNYDTPYNTYIYEGLPPGPIANVSQSSLEAVANPSDTDYLFFVADDNDETTTHFAHTLAEHEENIRNYCQVKCSSY